MKRKPLNKSRFTYLKQNTPLNVVPEKKLKKADLAGLIENRGKSRFRTKKLRERVETLIRSDLVFKNKTNAKPLVCRASVAGKSEHQVSKNTFIGNTLKAKYPFHLNMNAKRSVHVNSHTSSCLIKTFGCTLKSNTCINQILEKNKSINTPSLIGGTSPWLVEGVAGKSEYLLRTRGYSSCKATAKQVFEPLSNAYVQSFKQVQRSVHCFVLASHNTSATSHLLRTKRDRVFSKKSFLLAWNPHERPVLTPTSSTGAAFVADKHHLLAKNTQAKSEHLCYAQPLSNARCAVLPTFSKARKALSKGYEQKKTVEKDEIGTKYIVKRTVLGSTRIFSNTRFKVHSQDLKQLIEGRGRKVSPYKARLLERKKLSLIYGNLGWRELRKCVLQSKHKKGVASPKSGNKKTRPQTSSFPENLITLLESRLDVVLYRCRFFPSFSSCKQAINHGKIFVNHRQVKIAGHLLKAGDLIQVNSQSKQSLLSENRNAWCSGLQATSFKQEIAGVVRVAGKSEHQVSKEHEGKTFAALNCSALAGVLPTCLRTSKEHVVSKKANYLLALENEKQKTLLYFQNKIKSRPFSPSLPSALLTRFDPLHHFPWNTKQKPNQLNNTSFAESFEHNKQDYGSRVTCCFAPIAMHKRSNTPLSLNLENQANSLFRNLKERKRILRTLSSSKNERLDGESVFDRLIKPLRNRDNPSLFLRSQSKSGVDNKKVQKNTFKLARSDLPATGLRGLAGKSEYVNGLKKWFPPFYRAVKPLNLEVSYQTLTAIFLFPPQKVYFPANIDLEMIGKSI